MIIGSCVQGSLGFGLGLVAAPVAAIVDPRLVPGPLLFVAFLLTVLVARRERGALNWYGIRWALVGRVPGTLASTYAVAALPQSDSRVAGSALSPTASQYLDRGYTRAAVLTFAAVSSAVLLVSELA